MITPYQVEARRFMAGEPNPLEIGAEVCASCGVARATQKVREVFNSTFNQTDFLIFDSQFVCRPCLDLFRDKTTRSKVLFFPRPGEKIFLEREDVLPLLANPPTEPFVLCLPISFQKHTIFYAGLSTNKCAWVGIDDKVVKIDYEKYDIPAIIAQIGEMLKNGVPRSEVQTGNYPLLTRIKFGTKLDEWEAKIAPLRPDGAVSLFITYTPKVTEKIKFEVKPMGFSATELLAIGLLADLAWASRFRKNNGIIFWQTFFRRRLERVLKSKSLHHLYSALAAGLDCDPQHMKISALEELDEETAQQVFKEIKEKPDLMLAAAFTKMQQRRDDWTENMQSKKEKKDGFGTLF